MERPHDWERPGGPAAFEGPRPGGGPSSTVVIWIAVVAALLTGLGGIGTGPRRAQAPRVTKVKVPPAAQTGSFPRFSTPRAITNPLRPISGLTQVVHLGAEGNDRLRFETTLLPGTRVVEVEGRPVATVATQVVAYSDGHVVEVATELHAQADDGSVWHLGEETANYEDGVLVDHEGSWLAGRDGPPALVMPAVPRPGDVFRSESAPGQGAEEVTVRATDQVVDGPRGPLGGGLVVQEHLDDGTVEDKTFAPGYGELHTRVSAQDETYSVAVAVPIDAAGAPVPDALTAISDEAARMMASRTHDWAHLATSARTMTDAWAGSAPTEGSAMLVSQMSDRLAALVAGVAARRPARLQQAAIDVARASLDLQLRHRPLADVDGDRLELWAGQVLLDATAGDDTAVAGDVVALDALWARMGAGRHSPPVEGALVELRAAAAAKDLARVATVAQSLAGP